MSDSKLTVFRFFTKKLERS